MVKQQTALDKLVRFFSSLKCGLILLGLLGSAVILGTMILQRPMAREGQIEQIYAPQIIRLFSVLGLFDVFHAWWFILLLGLLGANITLASLERLPQVWRLFVRPHLLADEAFVRALPFRREIALNARTAEEALDVAAGKAKELGYKARPECLKQGTLYIEKHRLARLAPYIVHASLLLIFAGAIIDGSYGFRGFVTLTPGMRTTDVEPLVNPGALRRLPFAIRCDGAGVEKYPDGSPRQYWSKLAIEENGREVLHKQIFVNDPLTYKGVRFFQASYAPSGTPSKLTVDASWAGSGQQKNETVTLEPGQLVPLGNSGLQVALADFIPDFVLEGNQISSRSDEPRNPAIRIQVTQPGGTLASVWFFPKAPGMNPPNNTGVSFQLRNVEMGYSTGLEVAREPGQWLIWIGCLILTGGLMMALYLSHIRIWGVVGHDAKGHRVLILGGQPSKYRESFEQRFDELTKGLETELKNAPVKIVEPIPA